MATDMGSPAPTAGDAGHADAETLRTMRDELRNPVRKKGDMPAARDKRMKDAGSDASDGAGDAMASLERRLDILEKALADIANVVERQEIVLREREDALASVAQSVLALRSRMDQSEKHHADETMELRAALADACMRLNATEAQRATGSAQAFAAPQSGSEPVPAAPPIVWAGEIEPPFPEDSLRAPRDSTIGVKDSQTQSYLSAARRAANGGGGAKDKKPAAGADSSRRFGRTQFAIFGCAAPLMVVATASFVLNRHPVTAEPVPVQAVSMPTPQAALPPPPPPQVVIAPPADPTPAELASLAPLDKLQEIARAGDPKAERDIGLKYLAGRQHCGE